jgi:nitrous oxidase accessory protein NosD
MNNALNAQDVCSNIWHDNILKEGNYWDDYTGNDTDGDGIGDTPYDISGGANQDIYPLMQPYYIR